MKDIGYVFCIISLHKMRENIFLFIGESFLPIFEIYIEWNLFFNWFLLQELWLHPIIKLYNLYNLSFNIWYSSVEGKSINRKCTPITLFASTPYVHLLSMRSNEIFVLLFFNFFSFERIIFIFLIRLANKFLNFIFSTFWLFVPEYSIICPCFYKRI